MLQEQFSETSAKVAEKSLPKSLFKGKFHLSEDEFQSGLRDGDFEEVVTSGGKLAYSCMQNEHSTTKGKRANFQVSSAKEGSAAEKKMLLNASANWKMGLFQPITSSSASSSARPPLRRLCVTRTMSLLKVNGRRSKNSSNKR